MTPRDTNADSTATAQESVRSSITVPPDIIVGLLGSADENLRAIEKVLTSDVHVRGNEVTFSGEPADVALAERVVAELVAVASSGQAVTPETVRHSVAILTGAATSPRPRC